MPRFSIVIPVYDNAELLPRCLDSLLSQGFCDWEAIVVIDGSPDNATEIARSYVESDPRIRMLDKPVNEKVHLARKSGTGLVTGDYVIYLDGDDELMPDGLAQLDHAVAENPCDMLHFRVDVVAAGVDEKMRADFEEVANRSMPPLKGPEILNAVFEEEGGYRKDWRVTQRVYPAPFAKRAFASMTDSPLNRAEDAYEFFVLGSLAETEVTIDDVCPYRYHYGCGITGARGLAKEEYLEHSVQLKECIDELHHYADTFEGFDLHAAARGAELKLIEICLNDLDTRVAEDEKRATALALVDVFKGDVIAQELMRLSRDRAYRYWDKGEDLESDDPIYEWMSLARELAAESGMTDRYKAFEERACAHVRDLESRTWAHKRETTPVKIFVSTHKDVDLFESYVMQPVQVGCASSDLRFEGMHHDDEGENISELNPMYCELTTQYWAWKNVEADYYGFCHYRRYFDFAAERHEENPYGEIMDDRINARTQQRYGLDDENILDSVEGYDVITTEIKDLRGFPGANPTPLAQYAAAPRLHIDDLTRVFAIVTELHPDYEEDVRAFLNGNHSCFCNMFIMRKDIFNDYCEWLFPILQIFCEITDMSHYSKEALRTPGHLSERLFNVYYRHRIRTGADWRTKQVQCVHFEHPDKEKPLVALPEGASDGGSSALAPVVPVVFASDDNYAPMLTTTIHSMLRNASPRFRYDIVVLTRDISPRRREVMHGFLSPYDNVNLRFVDVSRYIAEYDLSTNNAHISEETYYRFLIQKVLPFYDKVVYLDSDLIIEGDVSELFQTELGDNLLGAVTDIDYLGNLNMNDGNRLEYSRKVLKMKDPYDYFQAGVLVFNTEAMRGLHTIEEWLEIASNPDYIYNDQDILNASCEGRVVYLDPAWNVMNDCGGRIDKVCSFAPRADFEAFLRARSNPKIIHFAGFEKPWTHRDCDQNEVYWRYARETPFYEVLLGKLYGNVRTVGSTLEKLMPDDAAIRRFVDPILPQGSRRREVVKSVARSFKGR